MRATTLLVMLALLVQPGSPGADETPAPTLLELQNKTRAARLAGDKPGWLSYGRQILRLAPDHPDLLISVARANAANGNLDEALALLRDAIDRGAGFDLPMVPEIAALQPNATIEALAQRARAALKPVSSVEQFVVFGDADLRPEGITHDPKSRRWFVGSLGGEIWQFDAARKPTRFVGPDQGLREVLGLKVDEQRRLLWAVSGVFPDLLPSGAPPKADLGLTGLHAVDLESGRVLRTCWLDERPALHGFNDLALARNGDVYVSDSSTSAVYRLPAAAANGKAAGQSCEYEVIVRNPAMTFPNGIVLSPDETRLYVAHVEGITAIDTRSGSCTKLAVPANASVNSIDGLAWHDGDLLGVQPTPYLARVARIRLARDGLAVSSVSALSSRPPVALSQTTGVVVGELFYTVAGLPNVLATAAAGGAPPRPAVLRMPLRPGSG